MKESRGLRPMLALNAFLTAGLLWTIVMGGPTILPTADAAPQYRSTRASTPPSEAVTGVGNAPARQRDRMIKSLDAIEKRLAAVEQKLTSGSTKVQVSNLQDLAIDYDRLATAIRDGQR